MSWIAYAGTKITEGTGALLRQIKRNANVDTESGIEIELNPTIEDSGTPSFNNPIDLVAQLAAGNRAYLNTDLFSSQFALAPNACYLITITNNDAGPVKYQLNFQVFTE